MRTIAFEEFAAMPEGTIFSYYEPMVCQGLYRKGKTLFDGDQPFDYFQESLIADCWNEQEPTVGDGQTRWAEDRFTQLYAIYEEEDVAALVRLLGNDQAHGAAGGGNQPQTH